MARDGWPIDSSLLFADAWIRSQEIQAASRKLEITETNDARKVEARSQAEARKAEADFLYEARRAEAVAAADAREAEAAASCLCCCSCFWVPWLSRTLRRRVNTFGEQTVTPVVI